MVMRRWTLLLGLLMLGIGYAAGVEPYWIKVSIHDLRSGDAGHGIRVVQLSDLHIQDLGRRELEVASRVTALKPDLIVLSGDVIDRQDRLPQLRSFLSALGGSRVVAVLGNWEHWAGLDVHALRQEYQRHGIRLLVNQVATYPVGRRTLHIAGMDDFTAGRPDSGLLNADVEGDTTLLVQHSPGYFETLPPSSHAPRFSLCLAGHTHGGQITLFGWPVWKPPGSGPFASGLYETTACRLYVSKGIGTSLLPLRFGARPEIAVFDL